MWGAVPPVYDTTRLGIDKGIHVHARQEIGGKKLIDHTYRKVILNPHGKSEYEISEEAAIYYMASSIFGKRMIEVYCNHCQWKHLDKDWLSVHYHRKHLCAGCGRTFFDTKTGIGNPLVTIKRLVGETEQQPATKPAGRSISIMQRDFKGGIRFWGSNNAILWTSPLKEETGIHLHCYESQDEDPVIDDTFDKVTIDEIELDAIMVRFRMAQNSLPHLKDVFVNLPCPHCGSDHFDCGDLGFEPHVKHKCHSCKSEFTSRSRKKRVVSNPVIGQLESLARFSLVPPQVHELGLRVEK